MGDKIRLDKWLWQARFFKSRTLSAAYVEAGHLRLNGMHVTKSAQLVGPGDVLTLPLGAGVRVLEIVACGTRRGPAREAQSLFRAVGGTAVPPNPFDPE